jgi:hypothetical protein
MTQTEAQPAQPARRAWEHTRHLATVIGGRGSCTRNERRAAQYAADQMIAMGIQQVRQESFKGTPSTYRPYALAFGAALLGTILGWVGDGREWLALAASLNGLGALGMMAESDFNPNWTRRLLPRSPSQNVIGVIPSEMQPRRRLVLSAHLDTHRTPIFYSAPAWRNAFGSLVILAFLSMAAGGAFYALGALIGAEWVRLFGYFMAAGQAIVLGLCLHADFTPYTPGANDNAAGVGVLLELGRRLVDEPLPLTEVWLVFTGCEETGAGGMSAFLDAHAAELGSDAIFVVLDEPGLGNLQYLTADGLVMKRPVHPRALELARRAAAALPELNVTARTGLAYTDAAVATKRKLIALSTGCLPEQTGQVSHWHQISDTIEHVDMRSLENTLAFTWQILKEADRI